MDIFSIFFNMKVRCEFSLESPKAILMRTHNIPFYDKKENHSRSSQICSYGILFLRTQERVRNSRGKRATSVRATEVLLYLPFCFSLLICTVSPQQHSLQQRNSF